MNCIDIKLQRFDHIVIKTDVKFDDSVQTENRHQDVNSVKWILLFFSCYAAAERESAPKAWSWENQLSFGALVWSECVTADKLQTELFNRFFSFNYLFSGSSVSSQTLFIPPQSSQCFFLCQNIFLLNSLNYGEPLLLLYLLMKNSYCKWLSIRTTLKTN